MQLLCVWLSVGLNFLVMYLSRFGEVCALSRAPESIPVSVDNFYIKDGWLVGNCGSGSSTNLLVLTPAGFVVAFLVN